MNTDGPLKDHLPRIEPPVELADRVRTSLTTKGLIHSTGENRWRNALTTSAIAASFLVAGFLLGRNVDNPPASPSGERYALLLYGGQSAPGDESRSRRREYGAWLNRIASGNRAFIGEELGPPMTTLGPSISADSPVVGFFVVSADDEANAATIARTSPHLKHGGSVVLYRVVE
jgi:hypothetical protein